MHMEMSVAKMAAILSSRRWVDIRYLIQYPQEGNHSGFWKGITIPAQYYLKFAKHSTQIQGSDSSLLKEKWMSCRRLYRGSLYWMLSNQHFRLADHNKAIILVTVQCMLKQSHHKTRNGARTSTDTATVKTIHVFGNLSFTIRFSCLYNFIQNGGRNLTEPSN